MRVGFVVGQGTRLAHCHLTHVHSWGVWVCGLLTHTVAWCFCCSLSWNSVEASGAAALGKALETNTSLTSLK